jgi:hypothetical protein
MRQMQLNPAPILLVHRGPAVVRDTLRTVVAGDPERAFTDRAEQRHRLWSIRDPDLVGLVTGGLQSSRVVIADGHHRYAAYLRMQQQAPGTATDRGLAMLVDQDDTPLFLGAIHRFLAGVPFDALATAASGAGDVTVLPEPAALAALGPRTLVLTDGTRWGTLTLADDGTDRTAVEVLHHAVLPGLDPVPSLSYHHSVDEALDRVARTPGTALLMPAPEFDAVRRVVARDHLLPEKATSFQPKPSLGVLMGRCATNEPAAGHLDVDAGRGPVRRAEEPAPEGAGHLHDVVGPPACHRPLSTRAPRRAVERVHGLSSPAGPLAAGHDDPEGPQ